MAVGSKHGEATSRWRRAHPAHNSGAVEGAVTRIKLIKRQLYGRANLALLRKLILLG